ncbi:MULTISPECIES: GNAT family N-acetyltransferase [Calothrix]|uniref:GNAT family N-acetyltransferase n=2 Tax=Calothrix TaxID=1186 RepID=A0ABR8AHR3_9CYAN|nr:MULTISPECIES: GNAT family N-acetyltransferase [Calothrix]MBD2199284.1 GNAT family N-acetyltransferase [Calothrix parietina FACHB-288]MBD2227986.1 GNAT family N-acetyltransferase [Calothrix anomala FACHB-343]
MAAPTFGYAIEPLNAQHNRSEFSCGIESLDRYLLQQAGQDLRRRVAATFILQDLDNQLIAGYYTLCATAINLQDLPPQQVKKLPRYPVIPATLLGRLAIDERYQGQGLGNFLLFDAFWRSLRSEVASYAVVVDAIDEKASAFYQHHQFLPFPDQQQRLYLPMATIASMFEE